MHSSSNPHHRQTTGTIDYTQLGSPAPTHNDPTTFTFTAGQFIGRTLRIELEELQKAESGRKYAKVDRRPLDPPPAVLLRLFQAGDSENGRYEYEQELLDVLNVGLMCTVDLFPVPETVYQPGSPAPQSSPGPFYPPSHGGDYPLTYYPLHPYMSAGTSSSIQAMAPPFQIPRRQLMLAPLPPSEIPSDALTPALIGEKFAEPTLVDYQGKKALVFVFGDLAVRREGIFILRYRAFDIFSAVPGFPHAPVLAELYGGPFKVFSTREFPGLEPSTDLTRNLAKYGVRVTLRDAERKSKKRAKDSE
ncbi:hypothetical protein M413DRAFT_413646 [Hebeloma cylindrosporum]|uniref:Velvet domain-containing protein n=1 Tax=Hebeloma cylindrosporum TaxID=76867 RepID=A0A0C3BU68_HEBCY|nr:hypothetical protein M413DRAFT_413646 [Hebeloma cylindrosporum h7]